MEAFIAEIIRRFGGRPAGTPAERGAQEFVQAALAAHCDEARLEQFHAPLTAHFGILKPLVLVYAGCLALFPFAPVAAIAVACANLAAFLVQFVTGRHWLDFLFPAAPSWNVEGVLEPTGEVRRTLLVAGHIDSVYEFKYWHRWGQLGGALTVYASFVLGLQGAALAAAHAAGPGLFADVLWWLQVAELPVLVVLYDMHDKNVHVDGAMDNLTGVALAVETARVFSQARLAHTRLRLVSFGAEEPFLRGSDAYAARHGARLRAEGAVLVNIDTIKERRYLAIVRREYNTLVRYPRGLNARLRESFAAEGVRVREVDLAVGGTDGAAFRRAGLPAVSIVGLNTAAFDPAYHTRLDRLENMNPDGIAALRGVLIHFIRAWDRDAG
jgi:hypothetical protein